MKRFIFLLLIVCGYSYGQNNEFKVYSNGLIYDETTMSRLGVIVDSLNIRFRSCDLSHPYYSYPQGMATWVEIPNKAVLKMMESGMSMEDFKSKYPKKVKRENLWILKSRYENYDGIKFIRYQGLPQGRSTEATIIVKDKKSNDKSTGWIIDRNGKSAFFVNKLERMELPFEYARLIQYVDCMVDTTAKIFFPQAEAKVYQTVTENSKAHQFIVWAEKFPDQPEYLNYEKIEELGLDHDSVYADFFRRNEIWDSLRLINLDKQMESSHYWKSLLMEASEESFANRNSDPSLEFYVARYLSKEEALKLMRSRKVMGGCSQDLSPRYHAMNICQLAAETIQWDIFLRSHLDIMNDRFERMSDGSYAYGGRKTYLKELEELDINALDLLLGTSLRVENVSDNHYWGSINRIGRALSDAENKQEVEQCILGMMQNEKLDPYNRLLMAFLFSHYAYNLEEEELKVSAIKTLETTVASFPAYIKAVWKEE